MTAKPYEKLVHVRYSDNFPVSSRMVVADFKEYQSPLAHLVNQNLHGWGVIAGLEVTATADGTGVQVAAGVAVDRHGQLLVLATGGAATLGSQPPLTETTVPVVLTAPDALKGKKVVVTMQFNELQRTIVPPPGMPKDFPNGKLELAPWLRLVPAEHFQDSDELVVLAFADIDNDRKVQTVSPAAPGVAAARHTRAAQLGSLTFLHPASDRDQVAEVLAAELRPMPDGRGLRLTAALCIDGQVNGRDLVQDGTLLDNLARRVQALEARVQAMEASLVPIGTIALFGSLTPPPHWLPCDGAVLQIRDYPELAQVLGCRYGGDGVHTFATPTLVGRFPLGAGGGRDAGATGGSATHTLTSAELPAHAHTGTTRSANRIAFLRAVHQVGQNIAVNHVVGWAGGGFTDHTPSDVPGGEHQHDFTTAASPGCDGRAFPLLPPFVALPFVIKAR